MRARGNKSQAEGETKERKETQAEGGTKERNPLGYYLLGLSNDEPRGCQCLQRRIARIDRDLSEVGEGIGFWFILRRNSASFCLLCFVCSRREETLWALGDRVRVRCPSFMTLCELHL